MFDSKELLRPADLKFLMRHGYAVGDINVYPDRDFEIVGASARKTETATDTGIRSTVTGTDVTIALRASRAGRVIKTDGPGYLYVSFDPGQEDDDALFRFAPATIGPSQLFCLERLPYRLRVAAGVEVHAPEIRPSIRGVWTFDSADRQGKVCLRVDKDVTTEIAKMRGGYEGY